ncbi:hypothetical protein JOM56_002776, partial [Amanita muscaria]
MTKLVNNIGTKMELGSPMISMYLLGNPDHYTSHKFTPFYWTQFVQEAMSEWTVPSEHSTPPSEPSNKIVIIKKNNRVIGLSPVYDYMFRSTALNNMDLFTWISRCNRIRRKPTPKAVQKDVADEQEEEEEEFKLDSRSNTFTFTSEHPLFASHATRCIAPDDVKVPNFLGPGLPRRDQGDREYYCATMLAFFKPWRSGRDLKAANESWDEAFVIYNFSDRQRELMDNFNLRYECLDGRDDFHAQMRSGSSSWDVDTCKNLDQSSHVLEYGETEAPMDEIEVSDIIGVRERKRRNALTMMTGIMQRLGWEKP